MVSGYISTKTHGEHPYVTITSKGAGLVIVAAVGLLSADVFNIGYVPISKWIEIILIELPLSLV
jgi:hypothetical protein